MDLLQLSADETKYTTAAAATSGGEEHSLVTASGPIVLVDLVTSLVMAGDGDTGVTFTIATIS